MITGLYRIAGKKIEICSLYAKVQEYCKGYETTGTPDFSVTIHEEDIIFEREKSNQEHAFEHLPIPNFSEETLEITAVYRKIADKMIEYDTFVFHGSAIAVEQEAFLFTAKSGTGKSTHTRLWREYLKDHAVMVNDIAIIDVRNTRLFLGLFAAAGSVLSGRTGCSCFVARCCKCAQTHQH